MLLSAVLLTAVATSTVKAEIITQAKQHKVPVETALSIADCESDFRPNVQNPYSSAKGVYQFTDPTWKWIKAKGHQYDYKENIKMFMKYYKRYPGWWKKCDNIL